MQIARENLVPVPAWMNIHLFHGKHLQSSVELELSEVISPIVSSCNLHALFPEASSCIWLHQNIFLHAAVI